MSGSATDILNLDEIWLERDLLFWTERLNLIYKNCYLASPVDVSDTDAGLFYSTFYTKFLFTEINLHLYLSKNMTPVPCEYSASLTSPLPELSPLCFRFPCFQSVWRLSWSTVAPSRGYIQWWQQHLHCFVYLLCITCTNKGKIQVLWCWHKSMYDLKKYRKKGSLVAFGFEPPPIC